jgi:dTDP-4-dehydrorhamnose reductase
MEPLELWAGIEGTVNRVGHRLYDQMRRSGHLGRLRQDLDLIAATGVRVLRYPCAWERIQAEGPGVFDWRETDAALSKMKELGLSPVVGLLHHGSGPRWTSLLDPRFPRAFARFARVFAERYPWVRDYTPINEPLTTARFVGLYGHWYPHGRDPRMFTRALVHEIQATRLALDELRAVNPSARLIQTEDRAVITSTPSIGHQAVYENHRSWLTFDLLLGRVDRDHPLAASLRAWGMTDEERDWLAGAPCRPDLIGINYYVTSDRFLDERLALHPSELHGGNGVDRYADVPTQRVGPPHGHQAHLEDAWGRYGIPLAITEVQLDAGREEQLRWLHEAWCGAQRARALGVDVRAVTVWALFGSWDWNSLCTLDSGHYEVGAWDVRAPTPRPTAIVSAMRSLAATGSFDHPVLATPGRWRRAHQLPGQPRPPFIRTVERPVLVLGAGGTLGRALLQAAGHRGLSCRGFTRAELDIADPAAVAGAMDAAAPWAVINAAGYVRVDDAERDVQTCRRANVTGAAVLAEACAARGLPFVTFSSDLVFDGRRDSPYVESDAPVPLGVYGASKAEAEELVLARWRHALIVRTSAFFDPSSEDDFLARTLRELGAGRSVRAPGGVFVSPTYVPALVDAVFDLLVDNEAGLVHLACSTAVSWADLARRALERLGLDSGAVKEVSVWESGWRAPRPRFSALGSERVRLMPDLDLALAAWARARPHAILVDKSGAGAAA